jgi:hypothetical protein
MAPTPAIVPMSTPRISHFWRYEAPPSQREDLVILARQEVRPRPEIVT